MKAHTSASHDQPITGDWPTRAACAGQPGVMDGDEQAAKDLCATCPVIWECTRWVMPMRYTDDPGGVVAGMTYAERKAMRNRARGLKAQRTRRRIAALERERVRDVDGLAAECPTGSVTAADAAQHRAQLINALAKDNA